MRGMENELKTTAYGLKDPFLTHMDDETGNKINVVTIFVNHDYYYLKIYVYYLVLFVTVL